MLPRLFRQFFALSFVLVLFGLLASCGSNQDVVSSSFIQQKEVHQRAPPQFWWLKAKRKLIPSCGQTGSQKYPKSICLSLEAKFDDKVSNFIETIEEEKQSKVLSAWTKLKSQSDSTDSECSTIILRNGEKISAKVLEIGPDKIKYRRCSLPDGPDFVLMKNAIERIVFKNGEVEQMNKEPIRREAEEPEYSRSPSPEKTQIPVNEPRAIPAFLFGLLGVLIFPLFGIAGLALGNSSLKSIKEEPKRWKGKAFAQAGMILGGVALVLMLIALIIAILFIVFWINLI